VDPDSHWRGPRRLARFPILAFLLACWPLFALDLNSLKPQGYVSDFAGVLDAATRARIEEYCGKVEVATGVQMALVTLPSLDGEPIEDVSNTLFRKWGIGKKGKDEGILLLLAIQDHKDRIEVGYGLEPILPDGFDGSVLRTVRPRLQQQDYAGAMLTAAEEMGSRIAAAKGVSLDFTLRRRTQARRTQSHIPWTLIVVGAVLLLSLFRRGGGGGGGSFLTGMLLGNVLGRSGGWGGGGFGGYDNNRGGGGGFGGFGGGDSGGGGASGSW
jgi:uncharacterized protein